MADTQPPPSNSGPRDIGPDGEKIKDMAFYDLLGVRGDATALELKKEYRKKALLYHPDKNPGDVEKNQKFVAIAEAMQILSDPQERAFYNRNGKRDQSKPGGMEMEDPGKLFAHMFGGEAFRNWIGEISLGKDIGKAFEVSTTEEEREQMKAEWAASANPGGKPQDAIAHGSEVKPDGTPASPLTDPTTATSPTPKPGESASVARPSVTKPAKLNPEQRAELEKYERHRRDDQLLRIYNLTTSLIARLRPFVEALSGVKPVKGQSAVGDNEEILRWEKGVREEAEDLKMESFGVELLRLIGSVYASKASTYLKLHRPKSMFANFLGLPKFVESTKQTGKNIKEVWGMLSSTLDVQSAMQEYEKRQEKGEISEEESDALSKDLMGKLLLVSWKGTRFESGAVLRQVVDNVLSKYPPQSPIPATTHIPSSDPASPSPSTPPLASASASPPPPAAASPQLVDDETLWLRAKGLLAIGVIFKSVQPDETDEERRELERLVADAAKKKPKPASSSAKSKIVRPGSPTKGGSAGVEPDTK